MSHRVTFVDAVTLERTADLLSLLHAAERAFCLEDVHGMWSAFDQVDPVELRRLEAELRERAAHAVELTSPLTPHQIGAAPVSPSAAPITPLHSVKVASEEPVTPALCWWLMETARMR